MNSGADVVVVPPPGIEPGTFELRAVPFADGHALSIGMTTVQHDACFGLYADKAALPDADRLAGHINTAIDELLELSP
jgi:hypothetical protein